MRYLIAIAVNVVVIGTGCSDHAKHSPSVEKAPIEVTGRAPVAYEITLPQLTSKTRKIVREVAKPVFAIRDGLPYVQKVSQQPILAVVEQGDWFFYATSTAADQETHQPVSFIAGYAIRKGGRQIIEWSVW